MESSPQRPYRLVIACGLILLSILALAVKGGHLAGLDQRVTERIAVLQSPAVDKIARTVTFFGSSPWMIGIVAVMGTYWIRCGRRDKLKLFLQGWLTGLTFQILLRYGVAQWRPDSVLDFPLSFVDRYEFAGFPSGHVFRSSFLFGWWFTSLRANGSGWAKALSMFCVAALIGVGLTRIYLNRHWMTDVFGSWLLAIIMLTWVASKVPMKKTVGA